MESFFDQLKSISHQQVTLTLVEENSYMLDCHVNLPQSLQKAYLHLKDQIAFFSEAYKPYAQQVLWGHLHPFEHKHTGSNPDMDPAMYLTL